MQDLLAMVPKPVLAVIMCFPITKEVDALAKEGAPRPDPLLLSTHQSRTLIAWQQYFCIIVTRGRDTFLLLE
jgi:hypothetical protein